MLKTDKAEFFRKIVISEKFPELHPKQGFSGLLLKVYSIDVSFFLPKITVVYNSVPYDSAKTSCLGNIRFSVSPVKA